MAYTYNDFLSELNRTGAKLSDADMELAKNHPDVGISLISLGEDYNKATTQEAKILAHETAEQLRKSYGGYSGGQDGSGYVVQSQAEKQTSDTLGKLGTVGSFSYDKEAPTYENPYAKQQAALLDEIMNREAFSYDKEDDPNWSAYKKQYLREGERATANALGQAAAASGGRVSTYAQTAASQAGDYYAAQLSDKLPELEQNAYQRYLDEIALDQQDLSTLNTQEQLIYAKYLDELAQHNTDRSAALSEYQTNLGTLTTQLAAAQGQADTEYTRALAAVERQAQQEAEARAQEEAVKAFAQQQVDAILAAGGTPSAELAAASGYANEYIRALEEAYAAEEAAQAAKASTSSSGSPKTDKPTLTAAQTLNALENGIVNETTLAAFEYYYGQSYDTGEPVFQTMDGTPSFSFDEDEGIYSFNGKQYLTMAELQEAINNTPMTDEQLDALIRKLKLYGVPTGEE